MTALFDGSFYSTTTMPPSRVGVVAGISPRRCPDCKGKGKLKAMSDGYRYPCRRCKGSGEID